MNNPSVLVLTDRTDLDRQISDTFTNVGTSPIKAPSVAGLERMLSNDYGSVFTSTIQKFQERDGKPIKAATKEAEADNEDNQTRVRRVLEDGKFYICEDQNVNYGMLNADGTAKPNQWVEQSREAVDFQVLSTKPNFYVLVDEAHRSQYGFLAAFMRASLPNARFIAFTGTPLFKEDKNTLNAFGKGGSSNYIDTYRLDEAVADGATLPIKYQEGMTDLTVDPELDTAFGDVFGQEDEARQKQLKQALLKKRRTARDRIDENAQHPVQHFLTSVKAKGFKGLLVCDGRDMAVRYKDTLDAIMAERAEAGQDTFESRVVISLGGITENKTGVNEAQAAYEVHGIQHKLQSIEERVRAEIKDGGQPIAVLLS